MRRAAAPALRSPAAVAGPVMSTVQARFAQTQQPYGRMPPAPS